jgi:hypothetical protein
VDSPLRDLGPRRRSRPDAAVTLARPVSLYDDRAWSPFDGALTPSELGALEVTLRHLWSLPTEGLLPTPLPEFVERVRAEVPAYRIVDFEDGGVSDLALELANLVEHLSARETDWRRILGAFTVDAGWLLAARRLYAIFWLTLVRPGGPSFQRNPPSTFTGKPTECFSCWTRIDRS